MRMTSTRLAASSTSLDVARRAGVSQSSVSLVYSGKAAGRVSTGTQAAILRAGRELDYRPHSAARSLRLGRSRLLVLAVPDVADPYFARVLKGAEREARRHGYAVTLATMKDRTEWKAAVLHAVGANAVDGFVFFVDPPASASVRALTRAAVFVDAALRGFPSIRLDVEAGVRAAMRHLIELGHVRIAHVGASATASGQSRTPLRRRKTYEQCLRHARLHVDRSLGFAVPFAIEAAADAAARVLRARHAPTAILCDSDILAAGVYKAARRLDRAIPEDLSVVSIDDSMVAAILQPELTSLTIPAEEIGERAIDLLYRQLEGTPAPRVTLVPLALAVRQSTARRQES